MMEFDFDVRRVRFEDRNDMLIKDSIGVVKCRKTFPIYESENGKEIFKPMSKTKPLTTPFFAISEVFWSTIINEYFDKSAPVYKLAVCEGYNKEYPSRYSKGTLVPSVVKDNERLVNLLEYYRLHPSDGVDIDNYINYCGVYYDYSMILNSLPFQSDDTLAQSLAYQILISILKCDINFHYENVAFVCEGDKILKLAPPIDHEFSIPFLYPDDSTMYLTYFGSYNMTLLSNSAPETNINLSAIVNNISYIRKKYPQVAEEFIGRLERFIINFSKTKFSIPKEYIEPFSTNLYLVFEAIFKEHENSVPLKSIPKFTLHSVDVDRYSEVVQKDVLVSASSLYKNLTMKR